MVVLLVLLVMHGGIIGTAGTVCDGLFVMLGCIVCETHGIIGTAGDAW